MYIYMRVYIWNIDIYVYRDGYIKKESWDNGWIIMGGWINDQKRSVMEDEVYQIMEGYQELHGT